MEQLSPSLKLNYAISASCEKTGYLLMNIEIPLVFSALTDCAAIAKDRNAFKSSCADGRTVRSSSSSVHFPSPEKRFKSHLCLQRPSVHSFVTQTPLSAIRFPISCKRRPIYSLQRLIRVWGTVTLRMSHCVPNSLCRITARRADIEEVGRSDPLSSHSL